MKRRHFLAGTLATMGISNTVWANNASDRKFIFVFAQGGWDPTRVFADQFSNAAVSTEWDAARATVGNIQYVTHPNRPSVDNFFENYHNKALICNGVQVRSIAHEICTRLAFTGGTSGERADWATILGAAQAANFAVPHMILGGPSFVGDMDILETLPVPPQSTTPPIFGKS